VLFGVTSRTRTAARTRDPDPMRVLAFSGTYEVDDVCYAVIAPAPARRSNIGKSKAQHGDQPRSRDARDAGPPSASSAKLAWCSLGTPRELGWFMSAHTVKWATSP